MLQRLLLGLFPLLLPGSLLAAEKPGRPNVVLIMTDDMGYADVGCYGSKDIRTPHIDRLAQQGIRLTDFYSNGPVCTPTRAALMTGRWQQRVGLEWAIYPRQFEPGLPTSEITLPRLLKNAGYRTDMVGKWHLGYKKEFGPNAHGFDTFYGLLSGNVDHYSHREILDDPDWYEDTKPLVEKGYSTDLLTQRAVSLIEKKAGKAGKEREPFFLYVAYNAVHWPFQAPDNPTDVRKRANWLAGTRKDYIAMVERVDTGVGQILAALDKAGVADNTLVIFTNDNGGERLSENTPFSQNKGTLWEGGLRVPCILRWPGQYAAGKVSDQLGISMDLTATILAAAGATPPKGRVLEGIDLTPLLTSDKRVERTFFWRINRPERQQKAVRQGKWKYLQDGKADRLFDLSVDPGESKSLEARFPEKVAELRQALAAWEKDVDSVKPAFQVR